MGYSMPRTHRTCLDGDTPSTFWWNLCSRLLLKALLGTKLASHLELSGPLRWPSVTCHAQKALPRRVVRKRWRLRSRCPPFAWSEDSLIGQSTRAPGTSRCLLPGSSAQSCPDSLRWFCTARSQWSLLLRCGILCSKASGRSEWFFVFSRSSTWGRTGFVRWLT